MKILLTLEHIKWHFTSCILIKRLHAFCFPTSNPALMLKDTKTMYILILLSYILSTCLNYCNVMQTVVLEFLMQKSKSFSLHTLYSFKKIVIHGSLATHLNAELNEISLTCFLNVSTSHVLLQVI